MRQWIPQTNVLIFAALILIRLCSNSPADMIGVGVMADDAATDAAPAQDLDKSTIADDLFAVDSAPGTVQTLGPPAGGGGKDANADPSRMDWSLPEQDPDVEQAMRIDSAPSDASADASPTADDSSPGAATDNSSVTSPDDADADAFTSTPQSAELDATARPQQTVSDDAVETWSAADRLELRLSLAVTGAVTAGGLIGLAILCVRAAESKQPGR